MEKIVKLPEIALADLATVGEGADAAAQTIVGGAAKAATAQIVFHRQGREASGDRGFGLSAIDKGIGALGQNQFPRPKRTRNVDCKTRVCPLSHVR